VRERVRDEESERTSERARERERERERKERIGATEQLPRACVRGESERERGRKERKGYQSNGLRHASEEFLHLSQMIFVAIIPLALMRIEQQIACNQLMS
jgi:hypothetical protein